MDFSRADQWGRKSPINSQIIPIQVLEHLRSWSTLPIFFSSPTAFCHLVVRLLITDVWSFYGKTASICLIKVYNGYLQILKGLWYKIFQFSLIKPCYMYLLYMSSSADCRFVVVILIQPQGPIQLWWYQFSHCRLIRKIFHGYYRHSEKNCHFLKLKQRVLTDIVFWLEIYPYVPCGGIGTM